MQQLTIGRYTTRLAAGVSDLRDAQALRHRCFRGSDGIDADAFDAKCQHVLIEDRLRGALVGCFRFLPIKDGCGTSDSYSAQFYDLTALRSYPLPMIEVGRFCIDPDTPGNAEILRVAWGAMTKYVDDNGVGMLFGCSSFQGTDAQPYLESFAVLRDHHLAPKRWSPRMKAPNVYRFTDRLGQQTGSKHAMQTMPPLLRTYLLMGGWVSDHAVVDTDLGTLHVFTGLEISAVPSTRARLLRAVASQAG